MSFLDIFSKEYWEKRAAEKAVDAMKSAKQGTLMYLWQFFSGFKSILLLLGATAILWLKSEGNLTVAQYIEFALKALYPGTADAPIVDPSALLIALSTIGTVAHAAKKAWDLRKAGVPAQFLNAIPPAAVDVKLLQAADAAGLQVPPPVPVVTTLMSVPAASAAGVTAVDASKGQGGDRG